MNGEGERESDAATERSGTSRGAAIMITLEHLVERLIVPECDAAA